MRSLTAIENAKAEKVKFEILCSLIPNSEVTETSVATAIKDGMNCRSIHNECDSWVSEASEKVDRRLSIDEIRSIRASYYTYFQEKNGKLV